MAINITLVIVSEIHIYKCILLFSTHNSFVYSILTGLMERKLVLESLEYEVFDLLEMSILLIDDIVEFDVRPGRCNLDTVRKRFCSDYHKTYTYRQHEYLLLTLLKVRCPVSTSISSELPLNSL